MGLGLAACTASSPASVQSPAPARSPIVEPSPSPIPPVVVGVDPGRDSPQAAIAGFLDGEASGDNATACTFVAPVQQPGCVNFIIANTLDALKPITMGKDFVLGTQAVVAVLGNVCANTVCRAYTHDDADIPPSASTFPGAYQQAASFASEGYAAFACLQVGGAWYVDLGIIAGATPTPTLSPSS